MQLFKIIIDTPYIQSIISSFLRSNYKTESKMQNVKYFTPYNVFISFWLVKFFFLVYTNPIEMHLIFYKGLFAIS